MPVNRLEHVRALFANVEKAESTAHNGEKELVKKTVATSIAWAWFRFKVRRVENDNLQII